MTEPAFHERQRLGRVLPLGIPLGFWTAFLGMGAWVLLRYPQSRLAGLAMGSLAVVGFILLRLTVVTVTIDMSGLRVVVLGRTKLDVPLSTVRGMEVRGVPRHWRLSVLGESRDILFSGDQLLQLSLTDGSQVSVSLHGAPRAYYVLAELGSRPGAAFHELPAGPPSEQRPVGQGRAEAAPGSAPNVARSAIAALSSARRAQLVRLAHVAAAAGLLAGAFAIVGAWGLVPARARFPMLFFQGNAVIVGLLLAQEASGRTLLSRARLHPREVATFVALALPVNAAAAYTNVTHVFPVAGDLGATIRHLVLSTSTATPGWFMLRSPAARRRYLAAFVAAELFLAGAFALPGRASTVALVGTAATLAGMAAIVLFDARAAPAT